MPTLAPAVAVLQLVIAPDAVVPDVSMSLVAREVRAIWAPYVDVVLSMPGETVPTADHTVQLRFADPPADQASMGDVAGESLGWIAFVNGEPEPVVAVSPERTRRLLAKASYLGEPVRRLPAAVIRALTAKAIGRAVAHEVGHYLLRTPDHAASGLMRATLGPQHIVGPLAPVRLTAAEVARARAQVRPRPPTLAQSPAAAGLPPSPASTAVPAWR